MRFGTACPALGQCPIVRNVVLENWVINLVRFRAFDGKRLLLIIRPIVKVNARRTKADNCVPLENVVSVPIPVIVGVDVPRPKREK